MSLAKTSRGKETEGDGSTQKNDQKLEQSHDENPSDYDLQMIIERRRKSQYANTNSGKSNSNLSIFPKEQVDSK